MSDSPDAPETETPDASEGEAPEAAAETESTEPTEGVQEPASEASEGTDGGEPQDKAAEADKPPKLAAAVRLKQKADKIKAAANAKLAEVTQREQQLTQAREAWQQQAKAWEEQVKGKMGRLTAIDSAAKDGRWGDLFHALGIDPKAVLDGYAGELQMPEEQRREMIENRRFRQEHEQRQRQEHEQRQQREQAAAQREANHRTLELGFDAAGDAAANALRFAREVGKDAFHDEAMAIQQQMLEAKQPAGIGALLREIERRARLHYKIGDAAPPSAAPSQAQGAHPARAPAAPSAPSSGKKPGGIRQRAAQEQAGEPAWSPDELDRKAAQHLRSRLPKAS